MKKTRIIHNLYKEWQKLPKEITNHEFFGKKCLVGKWHYHYKNKNGEIGLVRLNHNFFNHRKNYCYETCGVLDFQRFDTLGEAENAIYEKLGESIPRKLF